MGRDDSSFLEALRTTASDFTAVSCAGQCRLMDHCLKQLAEVARRQALCSVPLVHPTTATTTTTEDNLPPAALQGSTTTTTQATPPPPASSSSQATGMVPWFLQDPKIRQHLQFTTSSNLALAAINWRRGRQLKPLKPRSSTPSSLK